MSQIWSFICFPSTLIIRAPNSTPIVRSWTGWKRLSVNCNKRHDFPTPAKRLWKWVGQTVQIQRKGLLTHTIFCATSQVTLWDNKAWEFPHVTDSKSSPVSPIMMYLKRYLQTNTDRTWVFWFSYQDPQQESKENFKSEVNLRVGHSVLRPPLYLLQRSFSQ